MTAITTRERVIRWTAPRALKVNMIRAVRTETGPLTAIGRVLHLGRQTAMAEGSLVDSTGKLYAQATTTCLVFDTPID